MLPLVIQGCFRTNYVVAHEIPCLLCGLYEVVDIGSRQYCRRCPCVAEQLAAWLQGKRGREYVLLLRSLGADLARKLSEVLESALLATRSSQWERWVAC